MNLLLAFSVLLLVFGDGDFASNARLATGQHFVYDHCRIFATRIVAECGVSRGKPEREAKHTLVTPALLTEDDGPERLFPVLWRKVRQARVIDRPPARTLAPIVRAWKDAVPFSCLLRLLGSICTIFPPFPRNAPESAHAIVSGV